MTDDEVRIINDDTDTLQEHYKTIAVAEYDGRFGRWRRDKLDAYTILLEECFKLACRGEVTTKRALGKALVDIEEMKGRLM